MNKKAQMTIFVIIGMVMIASVMLFFYFRSSIQSKPEIITPESMPVKNFVEECINSIAKDGIRELGLNGGYINLPEEIENNPLSHLSIGPIAKNPYWWYDGVTKIPTEEDIANQISDEVTKELKSCLDDFETLSDVYTIKEKGNIVVTTKLNENDVTIEVKYPLDIISTINTTKTSLSSYRAVLPIRLKKAYELANAIIERENIEGFIERKTIDLMVLAGEDDIPINDFAVSCGQKTWKVDDIKHNITDLLDRNLQFIKIAGTNYNTQSFIPVPLEYSERQTYEDSYYNYHYIWTVMEEPPSDMRVAIVYDKNWPFDIYARPSSGNTLKSNAQKGFDMMRFFCLHMWHFTYDVSFPVMVTINDDKTSRHDEFVFTFAFKANIDHNQPARKSLAQSVYRTPDRESNEEYCNELENEVTIHTADQIANIPIDDVSLTFTCGGFRCPIGVTDYVDGGAAALIQTKFPYCVQGIIKGEAEGYAEGQEWIQTDLENKEYTLYMIPIKSISEYDVTIYSYINGVVAPNAEDLQAEDKVTITLKTNDPEFESFSAYPSLEPYPLKLLANDDFTYELEIYLIRIDKIIGGYKSEWSPDMYVVEDAEKIKLNLLKIDTDDDMERYAFIDGLATYSLDVPAPELI